MWTCKALVLTFLACAANGARAASAGDDATVSVWPGPFSPIPSGKPILPIFTGSSIQLSSPAINASVLCDVGNATAPTISEWLGLVKPKPTTANSTDVVRCDKPRPAPATPGVSASRRLLQSAASSKKAKHGFVVLSASATWMLQDGDAVHLTSRISHKICRSAPELGGLVVCDLWKPSNLTTFTLHLADASGNSATSGPFVPGPMNLAINLRDNSTGLYCEPDASAPGTPLACSLQAPSSWDASQPPMLQLETSSARAASAGDDATVSVWPGPFPPIPSGKPILPIFTGSSIQLSSPAINASVLCDVGNATAPTISEWLGLVKPKPTTANSTDVVRCDKPRPAPATPGVSASRRLLQSAASSKKAKHGFVVLSASATWMLQDGDAVHLTSRISHKICRSAPELGGLVVCDLWKPSNLTTFTLHLADASGNSATSGPFVPGPMNLAINLRDNSTGLYCEPDASAPGTPLACSLQAPSSWDASQPPMLQLETSSEWWAVGSVGALEERGGREEGLVSRLAWHAAATNNESVPSLGMSARAASAGDDATVSVWPGPFPPIPSGKPILPIFTGSSIQLSSPAINASVLCDVGNATAPTISEWLGLVKPKPTTANSTDVVRCDKPRPAPATPGVSASRRLLQSAASSKKAKHGFVVLSASATWMLQDGDAVHLTSRISHKICRSAPELGGLVVCDLWKPSNLTTFTLHLADASGNSATSGPFVPGPMNLAINLRDNSTGLYCEPDASAPGTPLACSLQAPSSWDASQPPMLQLETSSEWWAVGSVGALEERGGREEGLVSRLAWHAAATNNESVPSLGMSARAASAGDDATVSVWPGPFPPIPSGKPILPIFTGSSIQLSSPAINASVLCDVGNATAPTISEWLGLVKPKPTTANSTDVVRCDKPRPAPATPGVSASRRLLQSAASSKKAKHGFVVLSASATWMLQDGDAVHLTSRISHKICRSAPELGGLVVCDLWKPSNLTTFTLHLADASGNSATSGPFVPGPMNLAINLRDNSTGLYCEPDASAPGTPLACSLQAPSSWDASQPPMLQLETSSEWWAVGSVGALEERGGREEGLVSRLAWHAAATNNESVPSLGMSARAASAGDDATVSVGPGPFSPIPSGKPILPIFTGSSIQLSTPAINASVLCDVGNATAPTISEWLGLVKPKPTTANSTDVVRCDKPRPAPATPGVSASRRLLQSAASSKKAKHGFVVLSASATWMLQDGDAVHLTSRISHKICRSAPELGGLVVCDLWKPNNLTTFTLHLADASGNSATSGPFVPGPMNLAINLRDNSTGLYCEPDASAPGTPLACSLQAPSSWDASQPPMLQLETSSARAASAGDDATVSVWPGPFSPIPSGKPILPIFTGSSIQLSSPAINASVLCDVGNATAPTISEWLGLVKPKPTTANSTDVVRCDKPRPAPATPGVSASRRLLQSAASSKKAKHGFVVLSASATWMLQDGDAVHHTSRISHKICRSAPELGGLVVCDLWKPSNLTTFTLHLADASGNSATSGPFVPGPMNLAINLRDNSTGLYCEPDASAPGTPLACSLQAPSSWDASQPPMLQLETSSARAASAGDDATVSVWPGPFSPIPSGKPILPIFTGSSIQLSTPAINASVLCDVGNATAPTISEWLGLVKPKPTTANSTDVVRCDKPRPAPATPGVSASRRLLQSAASSKKAKHGFVVLSASATWMLQDGDAVHLTSRISHKICRSAPELGGLVVCDLWKPSNLTTFTLHLADASGNSATSGPFVPGPMNLAINLRDNSTGLYCEPDASAPGTPLACSLQAPSSWDASQPPMLQLETSSEWWAVGSV
ncbi:hypothetical protein QJQ45_000839 [Haematococcus lacustris]|nr:hypothetical protein QJQ45_000839 [Haematococcus lacustris]